MDPTTTLDTKEAGQSTPDAENDGSDNSLPSFDLSIKWTASERDEFALRLMERIKLSISARRDRDDRIKSWRSQYEAVVLPKNWPWPNSANLNVPMTRAIVDTIHADIHKAMTGVSPLFRTIPYNSDDIERAAKVERLLEWQMVEQIDIGSEWDMGTLASLRDGTAIYRVDWEKRTGRVIDLGMDIDPQSGQKSSVLVAHDDIVADEPRISTVDVLDFFMYPADSLNIEKAIGVGNRVWLTGNDLLIGARDGIYDQDQVDALFEKAAEHRDPQNEQYGGDSERQANVGIWTNPIVDEEDGAYELFDCLWLYDVDGDGIKELCHFIVEASTSTIIKAEQYQYWHGRRNYIVYTPYPRPKSFYGYSIPEILEDLQSELNAIRNQRVDAGTLILSPVIGMSRQVQHDPQKQQWRPGMVIRTVGKPNEELYPITLPNVTQQAFAEDQQVREFAEKVTGASDYAQGASPSRSRTLGEINDVTKQGNAKHDIVIGRLHKANCEIATQILGLDRQFLSAKTEFSITADAERLFETITAEQLRTRVRIVAQGNTINSDTQLKMQAAETLYQASQTNPLVQGDIVRIWQITNNLLIQHGVPNVEPYIGTLEDAKNKAAKMAAAPPQAEPPKMTGKLDEVMTLALLLEEKPELAGQLDKAAMAIAKYSMEVGVSEQLVNAVVAKIQGVPQPGQAGMPQTPNPSSPATMGAGGPPTPAGGQPTPPQGPPPGAMPLVGAGAPNG